MTFSGRLRLSLIAAALLPTILITIIVVTAIGQQARRIENRQALTSCGRFSDLLENSAVQIEKNMVYVAGSREFQIAELTLQSRGRIDPQYRLPLLSLDFLEYAGADGFVMLSADRPALVGRKLDIPQAGATSGASPIGRVYRYENDLQGSHPSLVLAFPTENGFLVGGIFLDGAFRKPAEAVSQSTFTFVDKRPGESGRVETADMHNIGVPYRANGRLQAVILDHDKSEFYILADFPPLNQKAISTNFFTAVVAVTLFSLLVVIPAGLYFSSRTRREIASLTRGAARVASGDFTQPIIAGAEEEFMALADSFNDMMKQLTDYRERLIVSQKIAAWQTIGRKVAHEVKNPLTPISIAADDLRRSFRDNRSDFGEILDGSVATIKREITRITKLIDQFSSFARMSAPEIVQTNSRTLVADMEKLFTDDIASGRLHLSCNLRPPEIHVDPDQFRQVMINLIKNALESGADECTLDIHRDGNRLVVTIEDSGPGLPERLLEEGITPYFSTKASGSGLGLVICQRIVYDHNGLMALENKPEGGARVTITLPQKHG